MRHLVIPLLFLIVQSTYGQVFMPTDSLSIARVALLQGEWLDLTNEGTLDFVFMTATDKDSDTITAFRMDDSLSTRDSLTLSLPGSIGFEAVDIDNNSKLDLLTQAAFDDTTYLTVYYQMDSGAYEAVVIDSLAAERYEAMDLDQDGTKEIVYSTHDQFLHFRKQNASGGWETFHEPIATFPSGNWTFYDSDNDGLKDLVISGTDGTTPSSLFYSNQNGSFTAVDSGEFALLNARFFPADFNSDGTYNLATIGFDLTGTLHVRLHVKDTVVMLDGLQNIENFEVFAADLDANGECDLSVSVKNTSGTSSSHIYFNQGSLQFIEQDLFIPGALLFDNYADIDSDGDLDRMIVSNRSDSTTFTFFNNTSDLGNKGPSIPQNPMTFQTGRGTMLLWEESQDDLTNSKSITYDVFIGSSTNTADVVSSEFDLTNGKRFKASRGNSGFEESMLVNRQNHRPRSR
ncbi:MAG: hypothetical protein AAGA66_19920 [Bacteroidota bacterium]